MKLLAIIIAFLNTIFNTSPPTPLLNSGEGRYVYVVNSNIELISNFSEKKSAKDLMKENGCVAGINGGFYTEDNKPLGLFINDYKLVQKESSSLLFNGFVSEKGISRNMPTDVKWGFQTGPMLVDEDRGLKIEIREDRPARRSVIGVNKLGEFVFISTDPVNLEDLPEKIKNLNLVTAVNLDGGSAAAFYSPDMTISESSPVGSWLCAK